LQEAGDEGAWPQTGTDAGGELNGVSDGGSVTPLRVEALAAAPAAVRRRALRLWLAGGRGNLRRLELCHVEAVERLLESGRGGRVAELPGGCAVVRRRRWLVFRGNSVEGGESAGGAGGAA